ncbi:MAG: acyltransferase [Sulfuriferula sp.]
MSRIESVDVFRFIAIAAVIVIHTEPFKHQNIDGLYVFVNQLARFAVPFFFVISGYFWGIKTRHSDSPVSISVSMAKKILTILIAWSIIYILPDNIGTIFELTPLQYAKEIYWNLKSVIDNPVTLAMEGTKVHLWFLVALLYSLGISAVLVQKKRIKTLIVLSVALYLFGLLAKAYSATPIGLYIPFNTRDGPFFGTIFFVSGYLLSSLKPSHEWLALGLSLLVLGYLLHFSEIYFLWKWYGVNPIQDYVIGTYFMGVGAAMASLSNANIFRNNILCKTGQLTLGIYAVHFIFVDSFSPIAQSLGPLFRNLGYPILVLFFSVALAWLLSMGKMTRKLVV